MDADSALADLLDLSPRLEGAALADADGSLHAAGLPDERARALLAGARELLAAAADVRPGHEAVELAARTRAGTLVAAARSDRQLAAVGPPGLAAALALHDVRTCLRSLEAQEAAAAPA